MTSYNTSKLAAAAFAALAERDNTKTTLEVSDVPSSDLERAWLVFEALTETDRIRLMRRLARRLMAMPAAQTDEALTTKIAAFIALQEEGGPAIE